MCRMALKGGRPVGSRNGRMRAIRGGGCRNIKEERSGCGRTDHIMGTCVDWNNGVPQILPTIKAHMGSSIVTASGIVNEMYMCS